MKVHVHIVAFAVYSLATKDVAIVTRVLAVYSLSCSYTPCMCSNHNPVDKHIAK